MRPWFAVVLAVLPALVPAQAEPPKPRTESERDRRLQEVVDEVVALVEKHAKLAFPKRPKVRATKHREWREIVKRELEVADGRELFEASIGTLGLYLTEADEIVLSPLVVGPLTRSLGDEPSRHVLAALAHHKATIAHEIVHALQQVHYRLPAKLQAAEQLEEIQRYKYLLEGHAVLIEELIAEREFGLEDFMVKGPYTGFAGIGGDPSYITGRRYFLHVLRTEGMTGVHAKLENPPTLEQVLARAKKPLPPPPEDSGDQREGDEGKGASATSRRRKRAATPTDRVPRSRARRSTGTVDPGT